MITHLATGTALIAMLLTFVFAARTLSAVAKAKRMGRGKFYRSGLLAEDRCLVIDDASSWVVDLEQQPLKDSGCSARGTN